MGDAAEKRSLGAVDWASVGERLTAYAVWVLRNRGMAGSARDAAGLGRAAEDLSAEAVADLLCGRCRFDPGLGSLEGYLRRRVRWKISHLRGAAGARLERGGEMAGGAAGPGPSAEEEAGVRERLSRLRERVAAYMEERKRKFDLVALLEAVLALGGDVSGIAARLGLDREQVYYQLRVLRSLAVGLDAEEEEDHGG